ncbi:hypothetical protein HDV05_001636 [Chytridiales sp. JEL 0842]|nr:hypothetical protein HDV05_001636 [Chytridiales sp. JEL 0842]
MTSSLITVPALLLALVTLITAQVTVLPGYSFDGARLSASFQVLATGIGSKVTVIYNDGNGVWRTPPLAIAASYSRPVPNSGNQEIWTIVNAPLPDPQAGIKSFYVRYDGANGQTYYANNNGQNYPVSVSQPSTTSTATTVSTPVVQTSTSTTPTTTTTTATPTGVCERVTEAWSQNIDLLDLSDFYPNRPPGGFHVTPIHATLLKDGRVFLVGWGRRDYVNCVKPDGSRKFGVSFVLSQEDILNAKTNPSLNGQRNPSLVIPRPIPDLRKNPADTLYCSGQVTLPSGKVMVVGGATYQNLGQPDEIEIGVSYARIFDPDTNSYSVTPEAPIGTMWYPTVSQLTNGDMLVSGGFARCCRGDPDANDNFAIYKPATNSWVTLGGFDNSAVTPGIKDYTHIFVLPKPTRINNLDRQVALMGYKGILHYYNTDLSTPANLRMVPAPNGDRKSAGTDMAYDSTALYAGTGEIITIGGGSQPSKVDSYNPSTSSWKALNSGVNRDNAASVLLPDGTILLINGQNRADNKYISPAQLYDPFTGTLTTLPVWSGDDNWRGYHSWAILLKDGRVLLGGGTDGAGHEIACERVDVRIFTPPYLLNSDKATGCIQRPVVVAPPSNVSSPLVFNMARNPGSLTNPVVRLSFSGQNLRSFRSASLMAFGSSTHSFDQHQRYIPLNAKVVQAPNEGVEGVVELSVPVDQVPLEGLYNLFLIGADGTPSVGVLSKIVVV